MCFLYVIVSQKVTKKERNSNSTSSNENHTEDEWSASSSAALRNGHRHSLEDEPEESNDVPEADEEEDFDEGRQGFECLDFDLPELVPIEEATEVHKVSGNEPVTLTTIEEQTLAPPAVNMVEGKKRRVRLVSEPNVLIDCHRIASNGHRR